MMRGVRVGDITIGEGRPFVLIAGPCVIESEAHSLFVARRLKEITASQGIPFIFKSSYDKANRLSPDSYRGPGIEKGLEVLCAVKEKVRVPVLTDVHTADEAHRVASVVDVIQIPALLCRQTDIVVAAAETGKPVNIKKGQFLAPWDMQSIIKKAEKTGNRSLLLTERGSSFGYNNLVSDFRSLAIMRGLGYPVIYDATHSVQLPGGKGSSSGGQRQFVAGLSRAAVAFGCDGVFLEVHPRPDKAPCDSATMIDLKALKTLLKQLKKIERSL